MPRARLLPAFFLMATLLTGAPLPPLSLATFEGAVDLYEDRVGLTDIFESDLKEAGFAITRLASNSVEGSTNTGAVGGKLTRFGSQMIWTVNAQLGDKSVTRRESAPRAEDFLKISKAWAADLAKAFSPQGQPAKANNPRVAQKPAGSSTNAPPPAITCEIPLDSGAPWAKQGPLMISHLLSSLGPPVASNALEMIWFSKSSFGKFPTLAVTQVKGRVTSLRLVGSDAPLKNNGVVFGLWGLPWHGTSRPLFSDLESALKAQTAMTFRLEKNSSDYQGNRITLTVAEPKWGYGVLQFDRGGRLDSLIWRCP